MKYAETLNGIAIDVQATDYEIEDAVKERIRKLVTRLSRRFQGITLSLIHISLSGAYTVEKGDYLFTLQNVINKRFTIEQGGTITWSENPYNAIIDISAVYKLKASLYDLLVNTYENVYQHQRIPVEMCIRDRDIKLPSNPWTINSDIR